jgi:hypothetical protein
MNEEQFLSFWKYGLMEDDTGAVIYTDGHHCLLSLKNKRGDEVIEDFGEWPSEDQDDNIS